MARRSTTNRGTPESPWTSESHLHFVERVGLQDLLGAAGPAPHFTPISYILMINTNAQIVVVCLRGSSRLDATVRALRLQSTDLQAA
jgi:hypothetical protein